ncbi:MAG: hypothetical protein AAGE18_08445 [Pseudomonadota bacterium]
MEAALGFLPFGTMSIFVVLAYLSIRAMEKSRSDAGEKSALSRDGIAKRRAAMTAAE